jgi:hypothetical protein
MVNFSQKIKFYLMILLISKQEHLKHKTQRLNKFEQVKLIQQIFISMKLNLDQAVEN